METSRYHRLSRLQLQRAHYFIRLLPLGALGRLENLRPMRHVAKPMMGAFGVSWARGARASKRTAITTITSDREFATRIAATAGRS
jgi:hypothetical protein